MKKENKFSIVCLGLLVMADLKLKSAPDYLC